MFGKPWSVRSVHATYDDALDVKKKLSKLPDLQVKIKRMADSTFRVKVRSLPSPVSKSKRKKAEKAARKKQRDAKT